MERKTKVALWVETLLATLLIFAGVLLSYFSSVASLNTVLSQSGSYNQIAVISQTAIRNVIPEDVKTNPLAYGVINWGVNRFVDGNLVQKLSEPTLNTLVKLAKTPTTIQGDNIVLDTSKYKTKLSTDINGFNIPDVLKKAGDSFVNAIPANLKIVDLNKHPNSILAKVIRMRDRINNLKDIVLVLSLMVAALAAVILVWSRESLTKAAKALSLTVVAIGGATLLASGILELVVKYVPLYSGGEVIDAQINTLIVGITNYYLGNVAQWGLGLLLAGLVVFIFTIAKVQNEIKSLYQKTTSLVTDTVDKVKTKKAVNTTKTTKKVIKKK